jgi:cyanophycinase
MNKRSGPLIVIGGREDKEGDREILKEVVAPVLGGKKPLVVVTAATSIPQELAAEYQRVFKALGAPKVVAVDVRDREEANDPKMLKQVDSAGVIFFTGGDQLRLTSQLGGTLLLEHMLQLHANGTLIAGTSAGAAAVPETMLFAGRGDESLRISVSAISMAPGLGLMKGVVIDSHFAERGRFNRLLGAVAQNPYNLGIGIDEDTAIVLEHDSVFRVIGRGAVYVVDGTQVTYSNFSEKNPDGILRMHNLTVHVLGAGDHFEIAARAPKPVHQNDSLNGNSARHGGQPASSGGSSRESIRKEKAAGRKEES